MEKIVMIPIKSCKECPHLKVGHSYSLDGFDRGEDWKCTNKNKTIMEFVEWHDKPEIPKWCPFKK